MITVIVDVGNYSTKYAYKKNKEIKVDSYSSVIHPYKPLDNVKDMLRVQYNDYDFYIGESVKHFYLGKEHEMYYGNKRKGHHEAQIRLVSAIFNVYGETNESTFNLVITAPYESISADSKYFKENFLGTKSATVNGEQFNFEVNKITMVPEGLGAFHFSESYDCVIIDAGSKTLNVLYIINSFISKEDSYTLNGGTINFTSQELVNKFVKTSSHVDFDFPIICTGGEAYEIKSSLEKLNYTNVIVANLDGDLPVYYVNSVGLILLNHSNKFDIEGFNRIINT